jgi:hypothetical protein
VRRRSQRLVAEGNNKENAVALCSKLIELEIASAFPMVLLRSCLWHCLIILTSVSVIRKEMLYVLHNATL